MSEFIMGHWQSVYKAFVLYFFLIFIMRIMGKRELAQLSVFDIIVFFVMSELLSLSISNKDNGLVDAIIPIVVIVILEIATSKMVLKWKKYRTLIEGTTSFLIYQGVIDQKEMKKQRYNLDDLMSELRACNISSPKEVQFAILEPKGKMSVISYKNSNVSYPDLLISDKIINHNALKKIQKDQQWLETELKKYGYSDYRKIFLCLLEPGGLYIIPCQES